MAVGRGADGQLTDGDGWLVNGWQPHVNARGKCRTCTVVDVNPLDRAPQRRHRVAANVLWSRGMALVPMGERAVRSHRLAAIPPRSRNQRRPRARPSRRHRCSRRFTSSSPPGGDDGSGDPEPSGLAFPQTGRRHRAGEPS